MADGNVHNSVSRFKIYWISFGWGGRKESFTLGEEEVTEKEAISGKNNSQNIFSE
jgi:hypothetical protein